MCGWLTESADSEDMNETRKHSSRMHTDRAVTRSSSEPVAMRPIVDRQKPVKTLPSLAVGNYLNFPEVIAKLQLCFILHFTNFIGLC